MPDLGMLNTLIAMVIVILVLSLVVQSLQTFAKKVLKLKSSSILNSLQDLFETITASSAGTPSTPSPQELVLAVTARLKEMGRKTLFGRPMLDSLAKGDLLKVLTRVRAEDLLPGAVGNFQTVLAGIQELKEELGKIETTLLQGEASAKFAAMQGSIMPLIHDLEALASGGNIDPAVFFGDLYKLRQIKAAEVLDILGQVQEAVSEDLTAAQKASDEDRLALAQAQETGNQTQIDTVRERELETSGERQALAAVDAGLKRIANQIAALGNAFDAAFAPLLARLQQVEVWYDTVMQGFEERYTRHMKTVGLLISIGVVVVLNANFFSIYRAIKADPIRTAAVVEQFQATQKAEREKAKQRAEASPSPVASPSPATLATGARAQTEAAAGASPQPSPAAPASPLTKDDVKEEVAQVNDLVKTYESFGIKPLSRQQLRNVWTGNYVWRDLNETFLGWVIMVMLLSAGAPFWQDTLESLFGLKNLLRQKSDTKNIEEERGGQPKP